MNSKLGAKVLIGLLYGQAAFGLLAIAAVVIKDGAPSQARHVAAAEMPATMSQTLAL